MEKLKPYLTFSHPRPGAASMLFRRAAEKNNTILREKTIEERRELMLPLAEMRLIPPGVQFQPVDCSGVPCEWVFRADSPAEKIILYLHGGSWAFGNLKTARAVGVMLCEVTGYRVLVAEYRLSPEFPFPCGLDDCAAVLDWLGADGFVGEKVGIFGDSAGGNLTLALIHRLRREGKPLPKALGLASPCTDLSDTSELVRQKPDLTLTQYQGAERDAFSLYLGDHDRTDPLISPVYGDLAGFPPMLIHVGQAEELCIDNDIFAQKAYDAGVDVALKIWKEMFHDFSIVGVTLRESRQSLKEFGAFFTEQLG